MQDQEPPYIFARLLKPLFKHTLAGYIISIIKVQSHTNKKCDSKLMEVNNYDS